jgi:hypothetical protein
MTYYEALEKHYESRWGAAIEKAAPPSGPRTGDFDPNFRVLVFKGAGWWRYATCGMATKAGPLELHLVARDPDPRHVEMLAITAHYHLSATLGIGQTVNFGRPWLPGSTCDHGLISTPHLDGPKLENFAVNEYSAKCLWLVPITKAERNFKKRHGLEALEHRFDQVKPDYLRAVRSSVV